MKKLVQRLDEAVVRRDYPISGKLDGWYFRIREQSPGAYCVEGMDLWGRQVSAEGEDEQLLLDACVASAKRVSESTA